MGARVETGTVVIVVMDGAGVFPWHYNRPSFDAVLRYTPAGPGDSFVFEVVNSIAHDGTVVHLNGNSARFVGFYPKAGE